MANGTTSVYGVIINSGRIMSDIAHIENEESGLSVRTKLNAVIDKTNEGGSLWEANSVDSIQPKDLKTVDASHLSGTIDGGPLHP